MSEDDEALTETPDLPDELSDVADVESAYTLELKDGSEYEMSGMEVLAVWTKYGHENWDRWVAAARDQIADWYYEDSVPARFSTRRVRDDESMADIVEGPEDDGGALYYGDLRAALMQLAFSLIAAEEGDEPVSVVSITGDGTREYEDPEEVLDA